jgi:ATP-dependent DNA ligase
MLRLRTAGRSLGHVKPCLPSPAKAPPSGEGWLHEIKHDGIRILARRDGGGVRLFTRHGNDFTSRFTCAARQSSIVGVNWQNCAPSAGRDCRERGV